MNIQERYWKELIRIKFELFYLEEYLGQSYKIDKAINMTTAIASSSSIAAWVIWKNAGIVWSVIIATSQVINAIKIYLPFSKRIKVINSFYSDMDDIFTKAEYNWFKISSGDLTAQEIHDLHFEIKKASQKIQRKHFLNDFLPKKKRIKKIADKNTETYFQNNY